MKNANLHDPPQFVPASYLLLDVSISVSISRVQRHCDGMRGQGGPDFSNSHECFPKYKKSQDRLCERQILQSWEVKWDKEGPLLARSCEVTNELSGSLPSFLSAVVPGTRKASQFTAPGLSWRKTSTRLGFFHSSQHCLQCRQHFMWAPTGISDSCWLKPMVEEEGAWMSSYYIQCEKMESRASWLQRTGLWGGCRY